MKKNQVLFCDEERKYTVLIKKISFKILFVLITVFYKNNEKKIYIYIQKIIKQKKRRNIKRLIDIIFYVYII